MAQPAYIENFKDADLYLPSSENSAQSKDTALLVQPALMSGFCPVSTTSVGPLAAAEWLSQPAKAPETSASSCCSRSNEKKTLEAGLWRSCGGKADKRPCGPRSLLVLVIVLSTALSLTSVVYTVHLHTQLEHEAAFKHRMIAQIDAMETALQELKEHLEERDNDVSPGELPPVIFQNFRHGPPAARQPGLTNTLGSRMKRNGDSDRDFWRTIRAVCESEVENYFTSSLARVHLMGANVNLTDNGTLLWERSWNGSGWFNTRGVTLDPARGGKVEGIKVDETGVYMVYSQVVVSGKHYNYSVSRTDCAQQTVVFRNNQEEVLMTSHLTQNNEGSPAGSPQRPRHPVDSSIQMGLFALHRQSIVKVKLHDHLGECRVTRLEGRHHATFFGLYRVA